MPTDNTGVQTRAMAQRTDSEPQEAQNQNVNPTVEPYTEAKMNPSRISCENMGPLH